MTIVKPRQRSVPRRAFYAQGGQEQIIVLLGIAVQNGVVLVAFFRQLRERGLGVAEMAWALRSGRQPRASGQLMLDRKSVV
jgi:hypothetical protein